jgi:hypothetical protein
MGAVLALLLLTYLLPMRASYQPRAIVVSVCPTVEPGIYRVRADFGIRFDVPEADFTVNLSQRDMPPGRAYTVTLKKRGTNMIIWQDDDMFRDLKNAFPVFSRRVGENDIRTRAGRVVGKDRWGDLRGDGRWRYVTFFSGDAVGYRPMPPSEARLFDQVVNSACLSPSQ